MRATFREATDAMCLSATELSRLLGVPVQSIRQARLAPEKRGHRPAPVGWERVLAKLARRRAHDLVKLAEELEG